METALGTSQYTGCFTLDEFNIPFSVSVLAALANTHC